jgi:hypothetical protein
MTTVDFVANTMPWAGSAIPAVMTYQNVQKLGFEWWQAAIIGLVVEGIGFVSITTAIDIYEANQAEREAQGARPLLDISFWVAIGGAAVYLTAVLFVNAILDGGDGWQKVTLALLSLFGVIGGVMVALRNQLGKRMGRLIADEARKLRKAEEDEVEKRRVDEQQRAFAQHLEEEKLKLEHETELKNIEEESRRKIEKIHADTARKVAEQSPVRAGQGPQVPGENAVSVRRWPDVPVSDWSWVCDAPVSEIVKKYGLQGKDPERQARKWKEYAKEAIERRGAQ